MKVYDASGNEITSRFMAALGTAIETMAEARCQTCDWPLHHEDHGPEGHPECPACVGRCDGCVEYERWEREATCVECGRTDPDGRVTLVQMGSNLSDPDAWARICTDRAACEDRQREAALAALTDPEGDVSHDLF